MFYLPSVRLKRLVSVFFALLTGASLLIFSDAVKVGVSEGLSLCVQTVIPSLFLFTALSLFISMSGLAELIGKVLAPFSKKIFKLNGEQTAVFLMSAVSGYPVGARLINDLYKRGKITREKALSMLDFCINPGPAFVIIAVGRAVLGSDSDGKRLLFACLLSTFIIALVSCRVFKDEASEDEQSKPRDTAHTNKPHLADSFVAAVSGAAETMLTVCAFVVVFAGILGAVKALPAPEIIKDFLLSVSEVTIGIGTCNRGTLQKAAFLIGFGGISVQLQVMAAAGELKPKFLRIFITRTLHGMLSAGFIALFEIISPRSIATVSMGAPAKGADLHGSPLAAAALVLLAVTLIVSCHRKIKTLRP